MIDTIAVIDDELIERMSMNNADRAFLLLEQGRKTEATLISTHAGGGAVNAAVSFSRLGHQVSTLVKLGRDDRAQMVRNALASEGVKQTFVVDTGAAGTGASVLISAHERNAAVFTFRGANGQLESSDLKENAFSQDIVYISGLSERSAELFPEIVDRAAAAKAFITANPGIRQLAARGSELQEALSKIALLSMNRDEAATLIPRLLQKLPRPTRKFVAEGLNESADLMRRGFSASGFEMSLAHFFEALLALGPRCILITDGSRGAYAATSDQIVFCPALLSQVVGTAGAGDAFTSTFTSMYTSDSQAGTALQYATVNASSVVGYADTQSGLLQSDALITRLEANRDRLPLFSWHAKQSAR